MTLGPNEMQYLWGALGLAGGAVVGYLLWGQKRPAPAGGGSVPLPLVTPAAPAPQHAPPPPDPLAELRQAMDANVKQFAEIQRKKLLNVAQDHYAKPAAG